MFKIYDNLKIHYPLNLIPRQQQIEGFNFVKQSINQGAKFACLDLPTGVGKSYFVIMFINWYLNYINESAKFDILTNSKILQDQYVKEYPFIKPFKGRSNYSCDPHNTDCKSGFEICKTLGPHCKMECPYEKAKYEWQNSTVGLTNFHLFDTLSLYLTSILEEKKSNVLIIDEAHDFESVFCDYISTDLSTKSLKKYGFDLKEIEDYDNKIARIKTIEQYIGFIQNQFIRDIQKKMEFLTEIIKNSKGKLKLEYTKYSTHCETQLFKFKYLLEEYDKDSTNWILDISKIKSDKMYSGILLEAKPIWIHKYLNKIVWDKYDHIILMSGTILNKDIFCNINGINKKQSTYYNTPSPFPIKNRPIYYIKVGKMNYTEKEITFKKQIDYIKKIFNKYKNEKGIIHTGTYEISTWLQNNLMNSRMIFHTPDNRDEMLEKHINSKEPTIIVSPSMTTGIDLKDDLSRFQIILKIQYPYLGSIKIKKRKEMYPDWYIYDTINQLVQSTGRSIRNFNDYCDTYILDSNMSDLLKYNSHLIPRWWLDSIKELK